MADLFGDALMLAIKIVLVTGYLFLLVYVGLLIVYLIEKFKTRHGRRKEVGGNDV